MGLHTFLRHYHINKHPVGVGEIYLARTSFIIQQTHHKAYSLRNISEHSVDVGADLSRPYIIS